MNAHISAHRFSSQHRQQVRASARCGCFYCLETFAPGEISEWVDTANEEAIGQTALCPRCGIDSVLGSAAGFPLTTEFLAQMQAHWF